MPAGCDKRSAPRLATTEPVIVGLDGAGDIDADMRISGKTYQCDAVDVSSNGVRLLSEHVFGVDEQLVIAIRPEGFHDKYMLAGIVRWQRSAGDTTQYVYGVEFVETDSLAGWRREFH